MNSSTFNSTRFRKYFSCYTATNAKRLSLYATTILIVWILVCILPPITTLFSAYSYHLSYDPIWETERIWACFLLVLFTGLSGSMLYSALNVRSARIGVLTAPASSFEKFLSWFIIYFFGMIVVFFASAFIADLIRVGIVKIFAAAPETAAPIPFSKIIAMSTSTPLGQYDANEALGLIVFYGFTLFNFAVFTLGSILFAKNSFMKTIGCIMVINFVLSYITYASFRIFLKSSFEPRPLFDITPSVSFNLCATAFCLLLFSFTIWLSYRRFKEADIIDRW